MRIRLIAVGTRMPPWIDQGFADYARRLPRDCALELVEIPAGDRAGKTPPERARQQEGDRMLKAAADDAAVALDEGGTPWSTQELARQLGRWREERGDVALLVGGPDGLDPRCLERARQRWSLSNLTLPHALVRVLVAEQIYRAWSLLNNHPYHRA